MCNRVIVIPDGWMKDATGWAGRQENPSSCTFLPLPADADYSGIQLLKLVRKLLRNSDARAAAIVLPLKYATGKGIRYWPDLFMENRTGIAIASVHFAGNWEGCLPLVELPAAATNPESLSWNATCQYQPPYTRTFGLWVDAGAISLHPGDYFRHEFLEALRNMAGHWLYWGHADADKLRGYHHLSGNDLLEHKPTSPLLSTLWFSCSTLGRNKPRSIALDWYLSGATKCMLASPLEVNTKNNQRLAEGWLNACSNSEDKSISGILRFLLENEETTYAGVLQQYRLLGCPWVEFVPREVYAKV